MPNHDAPPLADSDAADRLVDDMGLFLRGGPVPDTTYEVPGVRGDGTMTFEGAAATADPGAWTPSPAGLDTTTDREIGPYRVIRFVAHGGMGDVYHARHRVLPREVALKTIRARFAGDPAMLERFVVEAKAVENLVHPNVVKLYEFDERAAEPYIAMEWVPGGDLSKRLRAGPLPPRKAAVLVRALADAMAYAHDCGVLHRDLKPQNVLLAADGTPKVADFGLARLLAGDDSGWRLTQTGAVMGTPAYMAPEQADGKDGDFRTDVYALGAILYEALTGEAPFAGGSKEAVLKQVRESDPPRPSSLTPGLPADLEVICLRCLSKHADDRYQTAAELVADLDRFLNGEPLPRSPWRRLRRTVRAVRKRWRWAAVAAGVTAASAATVLVMVALNRPPDGESAAVRRAIEDELRAGRPVELIGAKGWPQWFRWRSGGDAGPRVVLGPDGVAFAETADEHATALLELLPDSLSGSYKVTAKVRHDWSKRAGRVGVYVGHHTYPREPQDVHAFTAVRFNDVVGHVGLAVARHPLEPEKRKELVASNTSTVDLQACLLTNFGDMPDRDVGVAGADGKRFSPRGDRSGHWHDVELTVTPDQIVAVLDGDRMVLTAATTRKAVPARIDQLRRRPDGTRTDPIGLEFTPRGGVGLYLMRGGVAIRDVSVTPLSE